ncbi:MAG TPA: hypothetical protein VF668_23790 [Pyrinomonadaceae bacterium]|jgi:hypothetical protein
MRKAFSVAAIVLALGCPVFAGEIHNPPAPAPPPASATQEPADGVTLQDEIPNDVTNSLTQTVLELLAVLPSLL